MFIRASIMVALAVSIGTVACATAARALSYGTPTITVEQGLTSVEIGATLMPGATDSGIMTDSNGNELISSGGQLFEWWSSGLSFVEASTGSVFCHIRPR